MPSQSYGKNPHSHKTFVDHSRRRLWWRFACGLLFFPLAFHPKHPQVQNLLAQQGKAIMSEAPRSRFPVLTIFLGLSGWAALFFSSHSKLISIATAAVGGVVWGVVVGLTSKIWARVERTIVELVGDALAIYIRDFASRYRKRYLEHLQQRHRTFDVKGLSTQGIYALEIEQVYVELTVDPTLAEKASGNPIAKAGVGRHDICTFLKSPQMKRQDFAILGAPGSGKTTLLKHITLGLAARRGKFHELDRLPLLLFIRDHAASIGSNPSQTIADVAEEAAKRMGIPAPSGWFGRELARGRCLVMLDGLDEVADAVLRKTVAEWVETQLQAFGANRFLVSSRPFGYRSNPLNRVTVLEVRPFNAEQGERFISNWYLANEMMSARKDDEGVRIAAREGADDLLKRIRANPNMAELAVNPLLLTMIANVHRYRSSLPGRRVELYSEICEVFLGKRQQARGLELDLTPAQKKRVLQPLAFHMMCTEKREIPLAEAVQAITGCLSLVNDKLTAEEFLRVVENSSGLLLERENGIYSFAHLTFQEYLAASYVVEEDLEDKLAVRVAIPWWHEVIHLYVALADATRIVEACIAESDSSVVKLTLAIECLEEALAVRPDLKTKVESLVIAGLEDPDPKRARLAAETKLALRLRRLVRVDDNNYVDNELISCAEYQLFIDDRRSAGDYHQPDHWKGTHFPAGSAQKPVLGVRPSDAEAFCRWLSERQGGEWTYQIPDKDLGHWHHDNGSYWATTCGGIELSGSSAAPTRITSKLLQSRLSADKKVLIALSRVLAHDSGFTIGIDQALDRILILLDRAHDLAVDRNLDLSVDPAFGLRIDSTLSTLLDRAAERGRDLSFDPVDEINTALDLARSFRLDSDRSTDLIRARALFRAIDLKRAFELHRHRIRAVGGRFEGLLTTRLCGILIHTRNRALDQRERCQSRALSRCLLLLRSRWLERHLLGKVSWLYRFKSAVIESTLIGDLLRIYFGLVALEERIEGRIPGIEGIRITKVRKGNASKKVSSKAAL